MNMRTLGMIGGTSWHATEEYYRAINEGVAKVIGPQANPELIIHSINIEIMRAQHVPSILAKYLEVSRKLETAGAQAIIICANTPHMAYAHVQPQIGIEILHIADAVGLEAGKQGLKRLALFGNRPTMTGRFIPDVLKENYGIETIIPIDEVIERSHHFVSQELTRGVFSEEAKDFYRRQINAMQAQGADGVILGCTELPLLLDQSDAELPLLATTDLHVGMAIAFILGDMQQQIK
jgi:aspartate racemase